MTSTFYRVDSSMGDKHLRFVSFFFFFLVLVFLLFDPFELFVIIGNPDGHIHMVKQRFLPFQSSWYNTHTHTHTHTHTNTYLTFTAFSFHFSNTFNACHWLWFGKMCTHFFDTIFCCCAYISGCTKPIASLSDL